MSIQYLFTSKIICIGHDRSDAPQLSANAYLKHWQASSEKNAHAALIFEIFQFEIILICKSVCCVGGAKFLQ
jgi:hypothetical protein